MRLPIISSIVILAVGFCVLAGCGAATVTPTTNTAMVDQKRVALVTSSSIAGYRVNDTLLLTITSDRLSVEGGGGIIPVAVAVPITVSNLGVITAVRTYSGTTETWTLTTDATGLVVNFNATLSGATTGTMSGSAAATPAITLNTKKYLLDNGPTVAFLYVDAKGRAWYDSDTANGTTASDTLFVQLNGTASPLVGAATVDIASTLTTKRLSVTVSGGNVTAVTVSTTASGPTTSESFTGGVEVTTSATLVGSDIGPWSANMAGHWLGLPNSGGVTWPSTTYSVTRTETPITDYTVPTFGAPVATTGNETETIVVTYANTFLSDYPVISETTAITIAPNDAGANEVERTAVYWARALDGSIRRVATGIDGNNAGGIVLATEVDDQTGGAVVTVFPSAQPADGAALPATDVRAGLAQTLTLTSNVTLGARTGLFRLDGVLSTTHSVVPTGPYTDIYGAAATTGTIQSFYQPGLGLVGRVYGNVTLERDYVASDDTGVRIKRVIPNNTKVAR